MLNQPGKTQSPTQRREIITHYVKVKFKFTLLLFTLTPKGRRRKLSVYKGDILYAINFSNASCFTWDIYHCKGRASSPYGAREAKEQTCSGPLLLHR